MGFYSHTKNGAISNQLAHFPELPCSGRCRDLIGFPTIDFAKIITSDSRQHWDCEHMAWVNPSVGTWVNIASAPTLGHFADAKAGCPFQARLIGLVLAELASPPCRPPLPTLIKGDAMNAARSLHNPGKPLGRWAYPPVFTQGAVHPA